VAPHGLCSFAIAFSSGSRLALAHTVRRRLWCLSYEQKPLRIEDLHPKAKVLHRVVSLTARVASFNLHPCAEAQIDDRIIYFGPIVLVLTATNLARLVDCHRFARNVGIQALAKKTNGGRK
jgi:hypothetical protein